MNNAIFTTYGHNWDQETRNRALTTLIPFLKTRNIVLLRKQQKQEKQNVIC